MPINPSMKSLATLMPSAYISNLIAINWDSLSTLNFYKRYGDIDI